MLKRFLLSLFAAVLAVTAVGVGAAQAATNTYACDIGGLEVTVQFDGELSGDGSPSNLYHIYIGDWAFSTVPSTTTDRIELRTRFGSDNNGGVRVAAGASSTTANDVPSSGSGTVDYDGYADHGPRQWQMTAWDNGNSCTTGWRNFA